MVLRVIGEHGGFVPTVGMSGSYMKATSLLLGACGRDPVGAAATNSSSLGFLATNVWLAPGDDATCRRYELAHPSREIFVVDQNIGRSTIRTYPG